jgi:hypothetical protein
MSRRSRQPRPIADTIAEQELIVFFDERAKRGDDAPLTAEEFMRISGELEAAQRLAVLKRRRAESERDEP